MSVLVKIVLVIIAVVFAFSSAGICYAYLTWFPTDIPFLTPFLWTVGAILTLLITTGALSLIASRQRKLEELKETVKAQSLQIGEKTREIRERDRLLFTVNGLTDLLLAADVKRGIREIMQPGLELIGRCMDADRVQIWQSKTVNGDLSYVHMYQWLSEEGRRKPLVPIGLGLKYREFPAWEERLLSGEWIDTPVSSLPQNEQDIFRPYDTESVFIVPIIYRGTLQGFLKVDDCGRKRLYSGEEIDTLYSAVRIIAAALDNCGQFGGIGKAGEVTEGLLDGIIIPGGFRREDSEVA